LIEELVHMIVLKINHSSDLLFLFVLKQKNKVFKYETLQKQQQQQQQQQ
jgi:hypothetical protein